MTRKKILLWFLGCGLTVVWAYCIFFVDLRPSLEGIIGVNPVLDKKKVYGTDWSRDMIFRKTKPGDSLYYEIIRNLESSKVMKSAVKTSSLSGDGFIFHDPAASDYHANKISMRCAFVWYEKQEAIIVHNGDNFVLVEDFKW